MLYDQKFASFNESLLKISRNSIIDSGDFKSAVRFILEAASECTQPERMSVWLYNSEKTKVTCVGLFERSTKKYSQEGELLAADFPKYFSALGYERVLAVSDAVKDPVTCELAEKYLIPLKITSMLDAPIRYSGEVVGVVCNEHVGVMRQWDTNEIYFAGIIGEIVSRAIGAQKRQEAQESLRIANLKLENVIAELKKSQS
jgi:GAF domain-containing protein